MTNDAETERISAAASAMGRRGGSVKSAKKAQTPDHYRRIGKLGAERSAAVRRAKKRAKDKLDRALRKARKAALV